MASRNRHRRSRTAPLTNAEKKAKVEALLAANPAASNRQIAVEADVSHPMVATVRTDLEATGKITSSAKTTGKDGKARSARKPRKKPAEASTPVDHMRTMAAQTQRPKDRQEGRREGEDATTDEAKRG